MPTAKQGRGKAVLIDGASIQFIKWALGIEHLNFAGLYQILVFEIGLCHRLEYKPVITMHPDRQRQLVGLNRDASSGGFEIAYVDSENEADDAWIRNRISCLEATRLKEIVIVTTDGGFAPALRHKVSQGVVVHWVATMLPEKKTQESMLSRELCAEFAAKSFRFVELNDFRERITAPPDICRVSRHGGGRGGLLFRS
jgi:hypothetical protein